MWGGLVPALTAMASWSWKVRGSPCRVSGPPSQVKTSIAGHPAEGQLFPATLSGSENQRQSVQSPLRFVTLQAQG